MSGYLQGLWRPGVKSWASPRRGIVTMMRWVGWLILSMLVGAWVPLPVQAYAAATSFQFTPGEVVIFQESGGGHGVGMSQWGARGRALAGQDAAQILAAYYRGTVIRRDGADQEPIRILLPTDQVVTLPFRQYLASVVSSELPPHWPTATLQAQAIASRTYARWSLTPDRPFDVTATVQSQVFGAPARPGALAAVKATAGQILTYQGKIIPAFFHACSPTWTASNQNVWPGPPLPFLQAIDDVAPDGRPYAQGCPYEHLQAGPFSTEELSRLLAANPQTAVGNLQTLVYGPRDRGGRLKWVTLEGDAGTKTVTATTFRAVISAGQPLSRTLLSADFWLEPAPPGTPQPAPVSPLPPPSPTPVPSSPSAPAAPPSAPHPSWVLTAQPNLSLRSAPMSTASTVATLPQQAPLYVLSLVQSSWYSVRDPATGTTGYVPIQAVVPWNAPASVATPSPSFTPFWVENFAPVQLWSGVNNEAVSFGTLPQWSPLLVLAPPVNGRYLVRVWATQGEAYVDGSSVGPAGPPSLGRESLLLPQRLPCHRPPCVSASKT